MYKVNLKNGYKKTRTLYAGFVNSVFNALTRPINHRNGHHNNGGGHSESAVCHHVIAS
ncbi:hypothetical protein [Necropsobacter massiliensis]|uniref:hypothetical protein n=1 Tax=Necropsobacter massiliensis TaxID=1400001 RepID=UPI000AC1D440|nr:hypothetical protein [Necropsobacter massiliensis]